MGMKSHKLRGTLWGAALGLGAPIGSLFFRYLLAGAPPFWFREEINQHFFFYVYMGFSTPLVFALFGYFLGLLLDKVFLQKALLETLNTILKDQSITDDMTGLYNHRYLMDQLSKEMERSRRYKRSLSFAMVDIDGFKQVNDCYGHLAGDEVLRRIGFILSQNIRRGDTVGRYGGDEFFLILPETELTEAQTVIERIKREVSSDSLKIGKEMFSVTVSAGLVFLQEPWKTDPQRLIAMADQALSEAKVQFHHPRAPTTSVEVGQ